MFYLLVYPSLFSKELINLKNKLFDNICTHAAVKHYVDSNLFDVRILIKMSLVVFVKVICHCIDKTKWLTWMFDE